MATRKRGSKTEKAAPPITATASTVASSNMPTAIPSGSIGGAGLPAGMMTSGLALDADVSQEFADLAPTFGDVLLSIGEGVSSSQSSLDRGLVDSAVELSSNKITVVTDVIQKLDDDGLPVANDTELVSKEVSLINYVNPTVHEWSHVALSMDLSVGAMDRERGVQFNRKQRSGRVGGAGLFWGFLGWFSHNESERNNYFSSQTNQEADWASGQVRMDAQMKPRDLGEFPTPAEVSIGPQIYFSQGSVQETINAGVVTARQIEVDIVVRKADGSINPSVSIDLDSGAFQQSFKSDEGFTGSTTNTDGRCRVTLSRSIPNARFAGALKSKVDVRLGEITKSIDITL